MAESRAAAVRDDLRSRIMSGEYRPGDRLPTLQELMTIYGVKSRSGLDRVLRDLEAEGLLTLVQGSGIYVRQRRAIRRDLTAGLQLEYQRAREGVAGTGLFEAMTGTETDDLSVQITYEQTDAPDRVAALLGVEPGTPVLARTFRYTVSTMPHQVARSYLPLDIANNAGLTSPNSERPGTGTIAQLMAVGIVVGRVHVELETRMPTVREAADLKIPPGTPVYEHWRVMYHQDKPMMPAEVSTAVVPGDRVAYVLDINLGDSR